MQDGHDDRTSKGRDTRRDLGRRRLLEVGSAGSVVAVFYPRTGLAATNQSANHSAMMSMAGGTADQTIGLGRDFWRDHTWLWHIDYGPGRTFDAVFGVEALQINGETTGVFGSASLEDVIKGACPLASYVSQCGGNGNGNGPGNAGGNGNGNGPGNAGGNGNGNGPGNAGGNGNCNGPGNAGGNSCVKAVERLGFQAVAALQNAATLVPYGQDATGVITDVQGVLNSFNKLDIQDLKNDFDDRNNAGAPGQRDRVIEMLKSSG